MKLRQIPETTANVSLLTHSLHSCGLKLINSICHLKFGRHPCHLELVTHKLAIPPLRTPANASQCLPGILLWITYVLNPSQSQTVVQAAHCLLGRPELGCWLNQLSRLNYLFWSKPCNHVQLHKQVFCCREELQYHAPSCPVLQSLQRQQIPCGKSANSCQQLVRQVWFHRFCKTREPCSDH